MTQMGVEYLPMRIDLGKPERPGEWLEFSPLLTLLITFCGVGYLVLEVIEKGPGIILDLNHYVFLFVIAGMLLHWRPRSFVRAVAG